MTAAPAQLSHAAAERLEAFLAEERRRRRVLEEDGRPTEVSEEGGGLFLYTYDAAGDLSGIEESDGRRASFEYDDEGRLACVRDESGTTRYRYGARGKLAEVEDDETLTRFEHDEAGRL